MFLFPYWFLGCLLTIASSKSLEALNQTVWRSRAVIHFDDRNNLFLCEFFDVEIDTVTIFFKARNHTRAVLDLYQCCTRAENHFGNCANTSIHQTFCRCFSYERFFPAVYYYYKEEVKQRHALPGITWLMNHYSWTKNPDHFMMKILEFRAFMANQPYVSQGVYEGLPQPETINHLVSQDYPVSHPTDYEKFVVKIVEASLNRTIHFTSLNEKNRIHFLDYLTPSHKLHVACLILRSQRFDNRSVEGREGIFFELMESCRVKEKDKKKTLPLSSLWHGEHVYHSPKYKNNVPHPTHISTRTLQESVGRVMRSLNQPWNEHEGTITENPVVAILQRADGNGMRSILNLQEVGRAVRKVFGIVELKIWYIAEDTPAVEQATLFHSADVIITTHSSQFTNLVFSRPGTYVIEIQPEIGQEYSFRNIGVAAGMNYYLLNKEHHYDKSRDQSKTDHSFTWRHWDYYVNITLLTETLKTIKQTINHHG
eukprot:gene13667-15062_t